MNLQVVNLQRCKRTRPTVFMFAHVFGAHCHMCAPPHTWLCFCAFHCRECSSTACTYYPASSDHSFKKVDRTECSLCSRGRYEGDQLVLCVPSPRPSTSTPRSSQEPACSPDASLCQPSYSTTVLFRVLYCKVKTFLVYFLTYYF